MNIEQARAIYSKPKGHSKARLEECLNILNESDQPIRCNAIQFEAILDAHRRLAILEAPKQHMIKEESNG